MISHWEGGLGSALRPPASNSPVWYRLEHLQGQLNVKNFGGDKLILRRPQKYEISRQILVAFLKIVYELYLQTVQVCIV